MIRPVTLADVDAYRQLRLDALQNHPTAFGQDYAEASSRPRSYWEEALTINDEEKAIFLAEHDRQLVGMIGLHRRLSSKSMHSANIWGVYVSPEWRGKHIAGALIRSCREWAKAKGVIVVKLGVLANNQSAIRCYERCGFKAYGVEPKGLLFENVYYDGLLMAIEP